MENIFKSLNENVSEACYSEIVLLVEEIINELEKSTVGSLWKKRVENKEKALGEYDKLKNIANAVKTVENPEVRAKLQPVIDDESLEAGKEFVKQLNKQEKARKGIENWAKKVHGEKAEPFETTGEVKYSKD